MLRIVISTMFDDVSLRLITLEHSNTVLIAIPPLLSNLCIPLFITNDFKAYATFIGAKEHPYAMYLYQQTLQSVKYLQIGNINVVIFI